VQLAKQILYEDSDVLVVNKSASMVVNRARSVKSKTVQDWAEEYLAGQKQPVVDWRLLLPEDFSQEYGSPEEIFAQRGGIAHRLDRDTSGALVIAKNPGSLISLLRQFRERSIKKVYTALVHGILPMNEELFSAPIARLPGKTGKFGIVANGRSAETLLRATRHFELQKKEWPDFYGDFSLVEAKPRTGRTHQIRVHLAYLSHPIVSDALYAGRKRLRIDKQWCPRQFLHASEIAFIQPRTKKEVVVQTRLANDLEEVLRGLSSR